MTARGTLPDARHGSWGYFLLIIGLAGISAFVLYINRDSLNHIGISTQRIWTIWGSVFSILLLGLISSPVWWRWKQRKNQAIYKPPVLGEDSVAGGKAVHFFPGLKQYLRTRYTRFWHRKVCLLLVTGDEAAIEQLVPGLQQQGWQEGQRIVLIYGASLGQEPDPQRLRALAKLRRTRPLDGIVRVLSASMPLTFKSSDSDLRGLEKISEWLGYSAPVWLWQLEERDGYQPCLSTRPIEVYFPRRATPEDITRQLTRWVPILRAQGINQLAENPRYDFLLRLSQGLEQGEIARWAGQLAPWLYAAQQRIPLRGLIFSLAERKTADALVSSAPSAFVPSGSDALPSGSHALAAPQIWQNMAQNSARLRGERVGMAWQRTLVLTLWGLLGIWGGGTLLSFALNYGQISSVGQKIDHLVNHPIAGDDQLIALHELRNIAGRLQSYAQAGTPWYQRFGLDHTSSLLNAMLPGYGAVNDRLIRDPAARALAQKIATLANSAPSSNKRIQRSVAGYAQLKAWLMMSRPDKVDSRFYAQTMRDVQPSREGISPGLWQRLAPDLWAFYIETLASRPQWRITPNPQLVSQSRQVLLQQMGRRNAESTLYEDMLRSVRRNFADVSLADMTRGTDARRLFTTAETVPGMFTRQAWEGGIQQAIEKAANARREEIDWVLSDSQEALSSRLSPQALKTRLTQRYFTDFAGSWLSFLNSLRLNQAHSIADVTDQLTLMSDVRQSPLIALMNTLAWQGQTGLQSDGLADSLIKSAQGWVGAKDQPMIESLVAAPQGPLDETFGPLLQLLGKNKTDQVISADNALSLQTYLTRITRVRLRLQQVASAPDPQEMIQSLAQTVLQGKSVDLTDTQQYGSLMAASLGEEWRSFGNTVFVQPLTQAWQRVLQPSVISLNEKWQRVIVVNWRTAFEGRYPFAASNSDSALPMLAAFIRQDSGRIDRFLTEELSGVLHKEGSRWVPDKVNSQGLRLNPAFLSAMNQLSQLSEVMFTDGRQGIHFELQARPMSQVVETRLNIDGQPLHYFNQMATWQSFNWPGETYQPGTLLTWTTVQAGSRLFGDYRGTWGFIRWLEQAKREQLDDNQWMLSFPLADGSTLQWVLRSQLGSGPLTLLALHNFHLPEQIFSVAMPEAPQPQAHYQ